ncbi:MAG TPA: alpha/beta fold hydrolase [Candidatus Acidoferrales bacterium]|nr:alpha/beta fold hydrolase [Candidatus Acidoferrales bacterium]
MPTLRSLPVLVLVLLVAATAAAQQIAPQVVSLHASDGTVLKGTYFASGKPGPGVLLLHQCNQQRKLWDVLGERLASSGINVLTFDYRGFGESGGTPHDKLTQAEEIKVQTDIWPGDIDIAFKYLQDQPGVARERIGLGGASCGVFNAINLARRHPEVKSLVLLAGPTDRDGRLFLQSSKNMPIFTSAADDDPFGPQVLMMQWFFSLSPNSASRFAHYASGGHGAEMFAVQKELPGIIADWFLATLENRPDRLPKTNGQAMDPQVFHNLELIDKTGGGGADQVAKSMPAGGSAQPALFPEFIVNILGYEHLQMGDIKGAVEILKLNVMAYPNSPNVYDSVSDAYLADGQKDLALQNAKKALELLAKDTADTEELRNGIRESAEQKIKQLTATKP